MQQETITCPNCKTLIPLSADQIEHLVAEAQSNFDRKIFEKSEALKNCETQLQKNERLLFEWKNKTDEQIARKVEERLSVERDSIAEVESLKARQAVSSELARKTSELADLQALLKLSDGKIAEAQTMQADLIRKQRQLDDARREFDLTVEQRVQIGLNEARLSARRDAEEIYKLKVMEKDLTIAAMNRKIEDLRRQSEQSSQQLQGEVQELELESILKEKFPFDIIEPVPKGEFGGDVLQRVVGQLGQQVGKILWESKRTKNWSDNWLVKLREDQRAAEAEIAVLISQVLPKDIDAFDIVDGIWVANPRTAIPIATVLRQSLIQISMASQVNEGRQTKSDLVYQYLTSQKFRHRIEAIVEAFSSMKEDLDKERKLITKQWAKREQQIDRVMESTMGMYGDLQGIAGKSLQEISGLSLSELPQLDETQ